MLVAFYGSTQGESTPKSYRQTASKLKISLRETAGEVMERGCTGTTNSPPVTMAARNTRSGKNGARKSCMRGSGSTTGGHREASMEQSIYELYMEQVNPQDTREIMQAEDTLTALLKLVENRELRDAIDRAAGRVAYLREVAAFEAGYGFMPE